MKQIKRLAKKVNKLNRYLDKKGLKDTVSIDLGYSDNPAITFYGNSKKELLRETDLEFGFRREPYEMYYKEFFGVECQVLQEIEELPDDHERETALEFGLRREPYEMYYKEFFGVDCQAMKETETLPDDHEMEKV